MEGTKKKPDTTVILLLFAIAVLVVLIVRQSRELERMYNEPLEPDMIVLPEEGSYNPENDEDTTRTIYVFPVAIPITH